MASDRPRQRRVLIGALALGLGLSSCATAGGADNSTEVPDGLFAPDPFLPGAESAGSVDGASTSDESEAAESTAGSSTSSAGGEPILLGELAYYTGDFASFGEYLSAQVRFPVLETINTDPPLGRPIEVIHEDIGTVGEEVAAKKLVEELGVDILLSPAHNYLTYRDWMLDWVAANDGPLMPSVHGGAIPTNVGGQADEPIFRAQGSDEGQGVTSAMYAAELGLATATVVVGNDSGFQLTGDAAVGALGVLGIDVDLRIDLGDDNDWSAVAAEAYGAGSDSIVIFTTFEQAGELIKAAGDAGLSGTLIGEAGWVEPGFIETATLEAIAAQDLVAFPGFGFQDNDAWLSFQPKWDNSEDYSQHTTADDFYAYTTFDLIVITALAIEAAGSVNASDWTPAMFEVTEGGTVCHTYRRCLALLRDGDDIDYDGITGPANFSDGGVNAVLPVVRVLGSNGVVTDEIEIDPVRHLEILDQVAFEFVAES